MTSRQAAIKIIKQLKAAGFDALLAGGCVRDMLLGRRAQDYDVATSARPKEVMALFRRTLKVGAKFGVVIVMQQSKQVEVATFRTETGYSDGRHPGRVQFSGAVEDAARRDFTINGMFYDPVKKELYDYVGGQKDLEKNLLRTIGNAEERFSEDYLRMLRAVRFFTQLGFEIEPETYSAICRKSAKISNVSGERIALELHGIMINPGRAKGIEILVKTGLLTAIFPKITSELAQQGIDIVKKLPRQADFPLVFACLCAGCKKQAALSQYMLLKPSRNQYEHVNFLLENRDRLLDADMSLANLKKLLARSYFSDLYQMQRTFLKAGNKSLTALNKLRRRIKGLGKVELKPRALLNGHDLMKLGAVQGPSLGQLAEELYTAQLEGIVTTEKQAVKWAQDWLLRHKVAEK